MKIFTFFFISIFLTHCFLIPRVRILKAKSLRDCKTLSQELLYDLQKEDFKEALFVCLKNKKYKEVILLASEFERQGLEKEEKKNLWIQKFDLYHNHLLDYKSSIVELKKILKENPYQIQYVKNLIQAYLKTHQLQLALNTSQKMLLSKKLSSKEELEFQFIQARILMLNQKRSQALKIFDNIKKKDFQFFKENEGPFYTALLLEETKNFDDAIEELKQADWVFAEEKKRHWKYRKENTP